MKTTIIQSNLLWEDKKCNLAAFDIKLLQLKEGETDLVILPEMFTTGFSMKPSEFAEKTDSQTLAWMRMHAARLDAVITGSFIAEENGMYYNRLLWVQPDGEFTKYDKRHLFGLAGEDNHYTAGNEQVIIDWRGWKVMLLVCYDLRFPVWSRNTVDYDLLLYVANWPERRAVHWRALLTARAIENQCFCIGVNRVGNDGNEIYHSGDSSVISPLGEILFHIAHEETLFTIELQKADIENLREKLPFLRDRDEWGFI
jgi:omega-amidase